MVRTLPANSAAMPAPRLLRREPWSALSRVAPGRFLDRRRFVDPDRFIDPDL